MLIKPAGTEPEQIVCALEILTGESAGKTLIPTILLINEEVPEHAPELMISLYHVESTKAGAEYEGRLLVPAAGDHVIIS